MRFGRFHPGCLVASLCGAAALVSPAAAIADAPWSTPQTIGGTCCSQQQLLALPAGGIALGGDTGLSLVQTPGGKPSFTAPVGFTGLVSPSGVLGPLALVGGGRTVEQMMPAGSGGIRTFGTIGTGETLSPASGRPGHTLAGSSSLNIPQAFVQATTDDAVLLRLCTKDCGGPSGLDVSRYRGGRWSAPRAITQPSTEVRGGALTTMADGTIAVAYERNHAIYVRRLSPGGRLSPAQRLGTGVQSEISIASLGGQRLAVGWSWQRVDEGDAASPFEAQVACSTGIGHFSGRSHVLASIPVTGEGDYVSGPGLSMKQDGTGRVTLAWTAYADGRFVVRTSGLSTSCATAAQTVALPGADSVLGGLAVAPSGQATVAILGGVYGDVAGRPGGTESAHGILATERTSAGAAFGAPVQVSAADDGEVEPVVAIDATSGRSVLAWRNVAASIQYASAP
ncbi:MAG TPA: hypothetical protein VIJ51_06800 [Solirubrobacteraceae bacterium]